MNVDIYSKMMNADNKAVEFANDDAAENYVLAHPNAVAVVVKKRIVVATFYGAEYEAIK